MTVLYVVVGDTSGAHELEGCYSIWSTLTAAMKEADRLNVLNFVGIEPKPKARLGSASESGGYYVAAVELDHANDGNIY